jgi:uncharacterized protein (UPF0254 family)
VREWLLILCASQICSSDIATVQVTEGQCRAAIEVARAMRERIAGEIQIGAMDRWQGARAICIAPDGKTRLDSSAGAGTPRSQSK